MPGMPRSWTDFVIELPQLVHMLFAFAFGACAGSFIHVVAWRMPEGMSVISPPSRCPVCGYKLPWYDNVPVIGWLRLRGRCGACQQAVTLESEAVWTCAACGQTAVGWENGDELDLRELEVEDA